MEKIKRSIITAGIDNYKVNHQIKKTHLPKAGDVAVFQVIKLGKHSTIQGLNGNNTYIFPGDKILGVFGNRYASEQFEGYVPDGYYPTYQLLGQGGVVGRLESYHSKFEEIGATQLKLIGYAVYHNGSVINTQYHNTTPITFNPFRTRNYKIYLSVGSSMDSGKTTTAAFFSRGLMLQKKKVAYIKLTGTVFAKDCSFVRDCGALTAVDFSYCGYPSTYLCSTPELMTIFETLLNRVERVIPDVVVVEIADGLYQKETQQLLHHKPFMGLLDGVLFSSGDSLSVVKGVEVLSKIGHKPIIVSGLFTTSPLMIKEVKKSIHIPVYTLEDFVNTSVLNEVLNKQELIAT
ncbi:MAG: hypothetical protein R6W78_19535 [Bacteroidales bacterium]